MNQIKICHDNGIMSRRKLIIYQPFSNDFPSKKPRYINPQSKCLMKTLNILLTPNYKQWVLNHVINIYSDTCNSMINYLNEAFIPKDNQCSKENLHMLLRKRPKECSQKLEKLLVVYTIPKTDQKIAVNVSGITKDGSRWLPSFVYHGSKTTVEAYYFARYKKILKYPRWPCIVEKMPRLHSTYYPVELLDVYPSEALALYERTLTCMEK